MLLTSKEANLFSNGGNEYMRRMYSEQELTKVIKEVFDEEVESGALDELVSDAVDAYLVEHPVDVTALEGQDVELNSLDATGLITGGEIVEKMSGYSISISAEIPDLNVVYAGVCKTGNKITFVLFYEFTPTAESFNGTIAGFTIPSNVGSKIYPLSGASTGYCYVKKDAIWEKNDITQFVDNQHQVYKSSNTYFEFNARYSGLTPSTTYAGRVEVTFLLSENLASEE